MNNLKQLGLALANYESANGCYPPAGGGTNFAVSPPVTVFGMDGDWSVLARLLPHLESTQTSNALNFSVGYWEKTGQNFTGGVHRHQRFSLPVRESDQFPAQQPQPARLRLTIVRQGLRLRRLRRDILCRHRPQRHGHGLLGGHAISQSGLAGQRAVEIRQDIDRRGDRRHQQQHGDRRGRWPRRTVCRLLHRDQLRGRPARPRSVVDHLLSSQLALGRTSDQFGRLRPAQQRRSSDVFDDALSDLPREQHSRCRANDELFSFHSGGVNCLFGDGSVRFVKNSINVVVLRGIITPNGGEVISADAL